MTIREITIFLNLLFKSTLKFHSTIATKAQTKDYHEIYKLDHETFTTVSLHESKQNLCHALVYANELQLTS